MRYLVFTLALYFGVPMTAAVTYTTIPGTAGWHQLKFAPKWQMPPTSAAEYEKLTSHLTFRVQSGSLLVAFAQPFGEHPTSTSLNPQVVDLRSGVVRGAQPGEWEKSRRIATHTDDPFREPPIVEGSHVSYARRQFSASGAVLDRYALSPDGSWLALMSHSENFVRDPNSFKPELPFQVLHFEIFQVSTGTKTTELLGSVFLKGFSDLFEDPLEGLQSATWISDRHFVVPTTQYLGAMLCDMSPLDPPERTAWDFVGEANEILGFWEEPQLVGYFNTLNSLKLHTAVRVAHDGTYTVKADLAGAKEVTAGFYPSPLEAGIRSIDAGFNYPATDGKREIRAMTLMSGTPSAITATATHLGSTAEYLSSLAHQPPEPPRLPSTQANQLPPPSLGRRLPDAIRVAGLDRDSWGKFAALSVSIPLKGWPVSDCRWRAILLEGTAGIATSWASVLPRQEEVTFFFEGAAISAKPSQGPLRLGWVTAECHVTAGTWKVTFDDNPLHTIRGFSREDFSKIPRSLQNKLTGPNKIEPIDDDHDGFAEFFHVQIGVDTSRRNCTLNASVIDPPDVLIGDLALVQQADGKTFSGYVEGPLFENRRAGAIRFRFLELLCGGQSIPFPEAPAVDVALEPRKTRRPFKIALSNAMNLSVRHVEYWVNCSASAPLRFPLSYSLLPSAPESIYVNVEPKTGPCTEHAFKISIDAQDGLAPGNYEQVFHVHAPGGGSWSGEEVRFQWKVNEAPEVFGVNPSKGIGPEALFHVAVTDRNYDIERIDLLINDELREQGGCYVSYFGRGIVLHSDDELKNSAARLAGQAGLENDRCAIKNGWDQLLRDVTIRFKPAFSGPKNIYARAIDGSGASSGWKQVGTWTASEEQAPEPIAVKPYLGSGSRQRFDFAFSDINGNGDIQTAEVLIQFGRDEANACAISLDRNAALIRLPGAPGDAEARTLRVGSQGAAVRNGQCKVSDAVVTTESRDALHLTINVEFDRSFKGRRNIYARAQDKAGQRSSWKWLGSWVFPNLEPVRLLPSA